MKKSLAVLAIFITLAFSVFAEESKSDEAFSPELSAKVEDTLKVILSADTAEELAKNRKIFLYKYKEDDMKFQIAPKIEVFEKMKKSLRSDSFEPIFLLESLHVFKKEKTKAKVDVAKILKSISKLKGIEYYSHSREKMRTLYVDSYVVEKDAASKYKKVADPLDKATEGLSILASQEDLTFGKYIYRYDYFTANGAVGTVCYNTEILKYKIFKVLYEYNLRVGLVVKEYDDFVLVYASTSAKFASLPGLEKKLKNSFSSRADAMYNWFLKEYKDAEKSNIGG